MHKTRAAAREFARELGKRIGDAPSEGELVIAPSFTLLDATRDPLERWSLAGQNVASERAGAYTGEVSAAMLQDAGCRYVIIGHSERRRLFAGDRRHAPAQAARAREARLLPIYCVGETAEDRKAGRTEAVLERQVASLGEDSPGEPLVVAYEPVWAIGTGIAAQPEHAAAARELLASLLSWRRQVSHPLRRFGLAGQRARPARGVGHGRLPHRGREPYRRELRGDRRDSFPA